MVARAHLVAERVYSHAGQHQLAAGRQSVLMDSGVPTAELRRVSPLSPSTLMNCSVPRANWM